MLALVLAVALAQEPGSLLLRLRTGAFDPLAAARPPARLAGQTDGGEVWVVQFDRGPSARERDAVVALGARVLTYLPDNAYVVRAAHHAEERLAELAGVRWVGALRAEDRLAPELVDALVALEPGAAARAAIELEVALFERDAATHARVRAAVRALGGRAGADTAGGLRLEAALPLAAVPRLAAHDDVHWIGPWGPPGADVDLAREIGGANYVESLGGYDGSGVRGEVADLGFLLTHVEFQAHPPIVHVPSPGAQLHGTAVLGILFANGADPAVRGLLPEGQGIVSHWPSITNWNQHVAELKQPLYEAVFLSSSVGGPRTVFYTAKSMEMDDVVFRHDFPLVWTLGNSGKMEGRPEAWAKNVITVSGNLHQNTLTKADDAWMMTSSVGPAPEGSIKPDFTQFYDDVRAVSTGCNTCTTPNFGGSSAATAIVAGYVGLAHELWHDGLFGNPVGASVFASRPHASTAKALLVNTACSYPFSGANHDLTRVHQGWGLPDVRRLYDQRDALFFVDETEPLEDQESIPYVLEVAPGEPELRATLVYVDLPGSPTAQVQRVNDLSLEVTSPSGVGYFGNHGLRVGNSSLPGGAPDPLSTVENVWIQNPEAGLWTVSVRAASVPLDGHVETPEVDQDFALVVTGVLDPPSSAVYCVAKPNSLGCLPSIFSAGTSSASAASGFVVGATEARNQKLGLLAYGLSGPASLPFHAGTLCVQPPLLRTPVVGAGGSPAPANDCTGFLQLDVNAFAAGVLGGNPSPALSVPGTEVRCQWVARDGGAPFADSLSNALRFDVGP